MQQLNHSRVVRALTFIATSIVILAPCIAALSVCVASGTAQATQTTVALDDSFYAAGPRLKLANGFLAAWAPNSDVSPDSQVKAFDQQGAESISINLLQSLPGAKKVVISDVNEENFSAPPSQQKMRHPVSGGSFVQVDLYWRKWTSRYRNILAC